MEFDINMIRTLCERYFDGETTSEEEKTLRAYFRQVRDIPADLHSVKVMVCGLEDASVMTYKPAARARMTARKIFWGVVATAAAVVICIGLFNREIYGYDAEGNAITDPKTALESTNYLTYLDNLETSFDIARMLTQEIENNN